MLSFCYTAIGQQYFVKGYVKDSISGQAIPFVNIYINGYNRGTVSDKKGFYYFVFSKNELYDTLRISCIGYQEKNFILDDIKNRKRFNISLRQKNYSLAEVVIKSLNPKGLLRQAINNISLKFNDDASEQMALYQERITQYHDDDSVSRSIVAAVGIKNLEFVDRKTKSKNGLLLYGIYKSKDKLERFDNIYARLPNLLKWTIEDNCLEYLSDFKVLMPKKRSKFIYSFFDTLIGRDSSTVVKILIRPKSLPSAYGNCIVYINMLDTVIVKIEFFHSIENLPRKESKLYIKTDSTVYNIFEPVTLTVEYKKIGDKYFLSYISRKDRFGAFYANYKPYIVDYYESSLIIVGKNLSGNNKMSSVIVKKNTDLYYLTSKNDNDFWDKFNFLIR